MRDDLLNETTENLSTLTENVNKLAEHVAAVTDATKSVVESYLPQNKKTPFYKQKTFWSILIFLSGLLGVLTTWQQQIRVMEANDIRNRIVQIQELQRKADYALTVTRVTIINQTIDCPVKNLSILKKMKQDRNVTLTPLASLSIGLTPDSDQEIKLLLQDAVRTVYALKLSQVCTIKPDEYDEKLHALQTKLNIVFNSEIKKEERKLLKVTNPPFKF